MKYQFKSRLFQISGADLVRLCNEKMVCAARDLAEFTKNGINASFIVALAHKCEHLENTIRQPFPLYNPKETKRTQQEIQEALAEICETGKRIWTNNPDKYKDYLIPVGSQQDQYPEAGSANVA